MKLSFWPLTLTLLFFLLFSWRLVGLAAPQIQETPQGPYITVTFEDGVNVRTGPNTAFYPVVGHLDPGEIAPAIGRTPNSDWIQIVYADAPGGIGWVYAHYVSLSGGIPPIVPTPPPPLVLEKPTLSPDLLTALAPMPTSTRLPTFTPSMPLLMSTYPSPRLQANEERFPMAPIILALIVLGVLTALLSRRGAD